MERVRLTISTILPKIEFFSDNISKSATRLLRMIDPILYKGMRLFIHVNNQNYYDNMHKSKFRKLQSLGISTNTSFHQPTQYPTVQDSAPSIPANQDQRPPSAHSTPTHTNRDNRLIEHYDPASVSPTAPTPVYAPTPDSTSSPSPSLLDHQLVVCIPDTVTLSEHEKAVLSKGLKFIPRTKNCDTHRLDADVDRFMRIIRLQHYFQTNRDSDESFDEPPDIAQSEDPFEKFNHHKSTWTPRPGLSLALDHFVSQTSNEIKNLSFQPVKNFNLSRSETLALKTLQRRTDIVIKPADKGGAVVVWDADVYRSEGSRQLGVSSAYQPLSTDHTVKHNTVVKNSIRELISQNKLPPKATVLALDPSDLGNPTFYLLPKIHKMKAISDLPPGRPIVSAVACPTERISDFLDTIFQPIVQTLPTYIKDTNHALTLLHNIPIQATRHLTIFTMDVTALYTSIPHADGLKAIRHFVHQQIIPGISPDAIVRLTELVLTLNSFEFNDKFFHQISGVAMGTKMGPSYANLFMGHLEERFFLTYNGAVPEFFRRYIDDCVGITTLDPLRLSHFIEALDNFHPSIRFTHAISNDHLPFLDINISLKEGHIQTSVHYKETDSHNYLLYSSSHPPACRNSIPFSQLLRLRRLCSDPMDFDVKSREMLDFFRDRGYPENVLQQALRRARNTPRTTAMASKNNTSTGNKRPILVLTHHPHTKAVKEIIFRNFSILRNDPETRDAFPHLPLVAHRRDKNLRDILVRSRLPCHPTQEDQPRGQPCNRPRCKTCTHISKRSTIQFPNKTWRIRSSFTCTVRNLVYVICCKRCNKLYIGETGLRLGDRFARHLNDIENDYDKPVAKHFHLPGHGPGDIEVTVLKRCYSSKARRKSEETRLILDLGTLEPAGLNRRADLTSL